MRFNPKIIFLLVTIVGALLLGSPGLNFVETLSQGDHGRDLYASVAVTRGEVPYKDFWWVYGPLMPYYYGLFDTVLGTHISSVLVGKLLLEIVLAVFFYLTTLTVMPAFLACISALWFLQIRHEFFFTFNHIGGIACALAVAYCLFTYMRRLDIRYLWIALIAAFAFALIKINFGLACLGGLLVSVAIIDRIHLLPTDAAKKKFYLVGSVGVPLLIGVIYWLLLKDLPFYAIRQCMPYFGDDQPHHVAPLVAIPYYLQQHWLTLVHDGINIANAAGRATLMPLGTLIFAINSMYLLQNIVMHASTLMVIYWLATGKITGQERKTLLSGLAVLGIFFVVYFHEFVVSGVWYRTYWSFPFLMLFHSLMIATVFKRSPFFLRVAVTALLTLLLLFGLLTNTQSLAAQKKPSGFLNMSQGQVFVGNEPQWTDTVNAATEYLNKTLLPDELFFALPYDCLYYYLTGKKSPTRQLIFFDHIKIPTEQERSIIQELENNKINYVLMSNRIMSSERGLGIFGKTYCPLIEAYIGTHFAPVVRQGGNWQAEPGWGNNHGVIIFKRK